MEPLFSIALATGFFGSGHCIGMCGGIVGALSLAGGRKSPLVFNVVYHLGRTTTYVLLGALCGWAGEALLSAQTLRGASRTILLGSDFFVIVIGLGTMISTTRWNVMRLEFVDTGPLIKRSLEKLSSLPPLVAGYASGFLFGLLPCGFLYVALLAGAQSGSPLSGGMTMLGFGIGTAPALLFMGWVAGWMTREKRSWLMRLAGLSVCVMGGFNLYRHLFMMAGRMAGHGG